jgi:hypothetical protein
VLQSHQNDSAPHDLSRSISLVNAAIANPPTWSWIMSSQRRASHFIVDDKEKQKEHRDGSVSTRIRLCEECVQLNIEANEAVGKFYEPKKGNGNWKKK